MICSRPEPEWDLAEAALLVAAAEYPDLDPRQSLAILDDLGSRAAERMRTPDPRHRALTLAEFLHEEEGFDGDREEYEDPRNSYLNDVLARRKGLPILLSLVYCEVGRRAGVPLIGVGLPGHFIVKVGGPPEMLLDPFNGGLVLTVEDCAVRIRELYGDTLHFTPEMLEPATPRGMLTRIIRNLKGVYATLHDAERTWRMTDLILCASPDDVEEIRDRGLLALKTGRHGLSVDDLEHYLAIRSTADDRDAVVEALRAARLAIASRN